MIKVYPILERIFQNKGNNPKLWAALRNIIQNQNDEIIPFCFLIKNKIEIGNKEEILLSLNILDFEVDYGTPFLWVQADNKDFLSCIINILKTKADQDLQNTILYLIRKWVIKFENNSAIQNCKNIYNSLKHNRVSFPNNIKNPYLKYLSQNNIINNNMNNYNFVNYNINKENNINYNFNKKNTYFNNMNYNFNNNINNVNNNFNRINNNMNYNFNNMNYNFYSVNNTFNNLNNNFNNMNNNFNNNFKNMNNNMNNMNAKINDLNNKFNNLNINLNNNNLNNNMNNNLNYKDNNNMNSNNIINNFNNNNINLDDIKPEQKKVNSLRQSRIPSDPNEYIKNINLDLNPNNYEKNYERLVNKLNDWTKLIQEINILIEKNTNGQNNSQLTTLCDELKQGKEKLVENIQNPKFTNEKLMKISLNVCEDMNMTINRYEKSIKGEDPGTFLSSFTRDDNPNFKKYNFNDFKYKDPLDELNNLGFGDTIISNYLEEGENKDNSNIDSSFDDLFEKMNKTQEIDLSKSTDIISKFNNDFVMNFSNGDLNLSVGNINKMPDFNKIFGSSKTVNFNNSKLNMNNDKNILNINDNNQLPKSLVLNSNIYEKLNENNDNPKSKNDGNDKNNKKINIHQSQKLPTFYMNLNFE